ncbi:uncharacterized protein LOC126625450 [Malus sylvestris]|uniref:uncharacterized protein LOC126625450 n=1 Tax=Malus sylvestris TaxID=3752 RepID=UPI0021AC4B8D|nr:uncharacterized protein LOC126625450 [Malus sylvestris]XP_050150504.1 uncharacterized protein LOC126625450 [Malus sylvestris]XP_050150509.1 uncharacterized protein LOC126625450 [Malus sylvestris]
MECPNCREIENGKWRYYVSCSPDHELDLSEDEMDYEDSPIEFLDMVKVQSLSRMIIMDENGKQARVRETGASSSRSTTGEVNALKEEVTTLKAQLAAQGEQMSIIVRALQMSGLNLHLILLHLRPPSHFAQPILSSLIYQTYKTTCYNFFFFVPSFIFFVRTSCMYIFIYFIIK